MPTEDAYQAVLAELARLAEAWRIHREVVNRAISYLNQEVVSFTQRLDKDDQARAERQAQVDAVLKQIADSQSQQRRWQLIRLGVELLAIVIVGAYLYGVSR